RASGFRAHHRRRVLGRQERREALGLSQAPRGREAGDAALLRAWVVLLRRADGRPAGARRRRLFDDGILPPPWVRGVDDGPRGLWSLAEDRGQLRYPERRRGSQGCDGGGREAGRTRKARLLRPIVGGAARRALRQPVPRARREARARRLRLDWQG